MWSGSSVDENFMANLCHGKVDSRRHFRTGSLNDGKDFLVDVKSVQKRAEMKSSARFPDRGHATSVSFRFPAKEEEIASEGPTSMTSSRRRRVLAAADDDDDILSLKLPRRRECGEGVGERISIVSSAEDVDLVFVDYGSRVDGSRMNFARGFDGLPYNCWSWS